MTDTVHRVIGRYEVLHTIGAGGMGVLWLARDPMIDRLVAIKLMREGVESATSRERFMREARSAGRLHHPNIVTIFDVGEQDGQPFIAMQYIEGRTLADVIHRQATLSVARKLHWMEDVCAGLYYAHRAGVIHRDIKPENVMVDEGGTVKILDFGIARIGAAGLTQGGIVGTLNYMAPEQLEGLPIDGRADIFSLGALLYELLSYRRAFPGGVGDGILTKILHRDPKPLDQIVSTIDPQLVAIVSRCLAKKADSRYADCLALARDVASVRLRLEQRDSAGINTDVFSFVADQADSPRRAKQREELLRIRAEEIHVHLARAQTALDRRAYDDAVRECERALVLDPGHDEAAALADTARSALEQQYIARWVAEANNELERGALTAASLLADRALSLNSSSPAAIALRAAVDAARWRAAEAKRVADADAPTSGGLTQAVAELEDRIERDLFGTSSEKATGSAGTIVARPVDSGTTTVSTLRPWRRFALAGVFAALLSGVLMFPRWSAAPSETTAIPAPPAPQLGPVLPPPAPAGGEPKPEPPPPPRGQQPVVAAGGSVAQQPGPPPTGTTPAPAVGETPPRVELPGPASPAPPPVPSETGMPSATALGTSEPPPAAPPAPAASPSPAESAAAARAADEAAIRAVLAQYKSAYERLDAAAVKRVVPLTAAQERTLADQFREYKSYVLHFQNLSISLAGSTATVRGRVARTAVPKAGRTLTNSGEMSFELQKDGNAWVITRLSGAAPSR